jgi:PAS domain S-box-containing protein
MTSNYAYTPQIWPLVCTVLLLIALVVYSARRRNVPGATPFMVGCLFAAGFVFGALMETAAVDLSTKIFWFKFAGPIQLAIVTAITCFFLDYVWPGRWLTRRNLVLLSIPCLLFLGLVLTNDLHHLIWGGFVYEGKIIPQRSPANWIGVVYAFGVLGALNLVALGWLFLRSPQHRWAVVIMLAGQFVGRTLYTLEAAGRFQFALQVDILGLALEFLMYAIALFGFRIFDPIPLACQTAIEQLHSGMLVLDPQGKIVSLNPAACAILGSSLKHLLGRPIQDLLPASAKMVGEFQAAGAVQGEIGLGSGPDTRYFIVEASALNDWRGLAVGCLLMLQDVTEQKQAQAQLLEQQRALAMLQEREQLARELHDSLGQAFAFVNAQGQAIHRLLSRGDVATADEYASRLVEVAQEVDVDIRESILGLRVSLSGQGFFPILAQYLAQYQKNYSIQTRLEKPETMPDGAFEPLIEVQLLRILQEALTNVRKHAGACSVQIAFGLEKDCVHITVQDDGQGFDPDVQHDPFSEHVGLRVMRERAIEIGGSVEIISAPGAGTQIVVEVPANSK